MSILYSLPAIFIAFSFHEYAHAYVADRLGDPTPRSQGRLTLDPFSHIDIFGFLLLLFAGFGWAKPVQINPTYFKDRKKGEIKVAVAGVCMNLILAFVSYFVLVLLSNFFIIDNTIYNIIYYIYSINIVLAVFNILPIPPLDGSKILLNLLPYNRRGAYYNFERYGFIILIILIITNALDLILYPLINFIQLIITSIVHLIL
ncbi:MAG: site-2 protease family protein [Clostridia bacterium]|nr:site-2 protease family protein [Clostridia bacterium]